MVLKRKFNGFLELTKYRKTTYEFSDKKVKDADTKKILEAARWAPSCSNSQPWHFVVIKNKKTIDKLMGLVSFGSFHTNPAIIIGLLLLKEKCGGKHVCLVGSKVGVLEGNLCLAMAAHSMLLEATDLGIQSALLSPEEEKAMKILKITKGNFLPLLIGFGYDKKGVFQKKRTRIKLKELVSYEFFKSKKGSE